MATVKVRRPFANSGRSNGRPKFQPLPDLPDDQFAALKADIAENGLQYPVVQDELGNTLDGHQRERALKALGRKNYPVKVIAGLSEEQKWHYALSMNVKRRHLDNAQKRQLAEQELRRTPDLANNWIAELVGVDMKTVQAMRRRLEATSEIPKLKKLRGKDGKQRVSSYARIITNTPNELRSARAIISALSPSQRILDTITAKRRARRNIRREERNGKAARPRVKSEHGIFHCRFQELEKAARLRRASVDLILTDIPYGRDFLDQLDDLGAFAKRVLKRGGLFVTHCGQFHLPVVMDTFGRHLTYRWMIASLWNGDANIVHPLHIASQWKPILIFSNGPWRERKRWSDLSVLDGKNKDRHKWQQSLVECEALMRRFSDAGDLVCDPCGGAFTSAVASALLGRRFVGCDCDEECVRIGLERLVARGNWS